MENTQTRQGFRLGDWIESNPVQRVIVALILINAVTLGLETSAAMMERFGPALRLIDAAILSVFVLEIAAKLVAFGPRFFRNPWNVFDFLVVGVALVPAAGPLSILRALRVLRLLRLVTMVPQLRFVVRSLLQAIPGLSSIAVLMLLIFYVFGVMATGLFGGAFPEWFGGIGRSMYTLFQVMTLESWSMGIARPVMEQFPYAWAFFVPFILITTFTMLNLFIGIIVDTMQTLHEGQHERDTREFEKTVQDESLVVDQELRALREEIRFLRESLSRETS